MGSKRISFSLLGGLKMRKEVLKTDLQVTDIPAIMKPSNRWSHQGRVSGLIQGEKREGQGQYL